MEKRPQLQPGGRRAQEIMEINGPLTPKVPLTNDLCGVAEQLIPHGAGGPRSQRCCRQPRAQPPAESTAQSRRQGRGSSAFSQQREHSRSFSPPVLLQSLLTCLPTHWKPAQPSPQLVPESSPIGVWRWGGMWTPSLTGLARCHRSAGERGTQQPPAILQGFGVETCTSSFKLVRERPAPRFRASATGA